MKYECRVGGHASDAARFEKMLPHIERLVLDEAGRAHVLAKDGRSGGFSTSWLNGYSVSLVAAEIESHIPPREEPEVFGLSYAEANETATARAEVAAAMPDVHKLSADVLSGVCHMVAKLKSGREFRMRFVDKHLHDDGTPFIREIVKRLRFAATDETMEINVQVAPPLDAKALDEVTAMLDQIGRG